MRSKLRAEPPGFPRIGETATPTRESGAKIPAAKARERGTSELIERAPPCQLCAKTQLEFGGDGALRIEAPA